MSNVEQGSVLEGEVLRTLYFDEESSFSIVLVQDDSGERHKVCGIIPQLSEGQRLKAHGKVEVHPKYGPQFKVENVDVGDPVTEDGIIAFLESGLIEGIGSEYSRRIVNSFGKDTIRIIDDEPDRLRDVPGIGPKRARKIKESWKKQKVLRDAMLFLQSHGISAVYAMKIWKKYRNETIAKVQANPYRLVIDIHGIGFRKADAIAGKLGIPRNSPFRIEAGVRYTLREASGEGHCYLPYNELAGKSAELLDFSAKATEKAVDVLAGKGDVVHYSRMGDDGAVHDDVYDVMLDHAEDKVAFHIRELIDSTKRVRDVNLSKEICNMESVIGVTLGEEQKKAVASAVNHKVVIITGGPGTGKTTIINFILGIYKKLGLDVMLAAPTGRAAKRMEESTGHEAKTIHRMLGFSPDGGFHHDEDNPLPADVVIIDESSMIDVFLMSSLVRAVPPEATLILVGDIDQLPSVGPGNILRDLIGSGKIPVSFLCHIYRQGDDSSIVLNSHLINSGKMPSLNTTRDFRFIKEEDPERILKYIVSISRQNANRVQVLSPMHRGIIGVKNLNVVLQNAINPHGRPFATGKRRFCVGDRVIQTVNNYEKDVFNGDMGVIVNYDEDEKIVYVEYDGRPVRYQGIEFNDVELAYCCSIHKSQGAEYPMVVMPVSTQHYVMLQRNLIYTGLTRAKEEAVLIGSVKALGMAVRNDGVRKRYSGLKERLTGGIEKWRASTELF